MNGDWWAWSVLTLVPPRRPWFPLPNRDKDRERHLAWNPDHPSRLTSLDVHTVGYAYGITGRHQGDCQLFRFDPSSDMYELGGQIVDQEGVPMRQYHNVTITPDGIVYARDNDDPYRSGYLWEAGL